MNENITVSKVFFEHLLNCLANQKYIRDIGPTDQSMDEIRASVRARQEAIDIAYDQGMRLLLYGEQPIP